MFNYIKNLSKSFDRQFSENGLLRFDIKLQLVLFCSLLLFVLFIACKLSFSSIGMWNEIFPEEGISTTLFGKPKGIRSDEWLVISPMYLSQMQQNGTLDSQNLGVKGSALLLSLPTTSIFSIIRPSLIGAAFLSEEFAFSYSWAVRTIVFWLSSFLVLMLLTKNRFLISFLCSLFLYFSGFVQWWFSSVNLYMTSINVIFLASCYFILSSKKTNILLATIIGSLFFIDFVLVLYPPFLIPLVHLYLFILIGWSLDNWDKKRIFKYLHLKIALFFIVIFSLTTFFLSFYNSAKEAIYLIQHTVYPGARSISGGGLPFSDLFTGFFTLFLTESIATKLGTNICELSNFTFVWPLLFFPFFKIKNISGVRYLFISLAAYFIFISIWIFYGFPEPLAKITLMNVVQPKRAFIGMGMANTFFLAVFMSMNHFELTKSKALKVISFLFLLLLLSIFSYYSYKRSLELGVLQNPQHLVLFIIAYSSILIALYYRKKIALFLLAGIAVFSTCSVNPIEHGIAAIKGKELSKVIKKESAGENYWIAYNDNNITANFAMANGANVFNGTKYTPLLEELAILDPEHKYTQIYNRYAHIAVNPLPDKKAPPQFKLFSPDAYIIEIHPCSPYLKKLGITHFIFSGKPAPELTRCLTPLNQEPLSGSVFIYKRKNKRIKL